MFIMKIKKYLSSTKLKNTLEHDSKYFHFCGMILLFSTSMQLSYKGVEVVTVNTYINNCVYIDSHKTRTWETAYHFKCFLCKHKNLILELQNSFQARYSGIFWKLQSWGHIKQQTPDTFRLISLGKSVNSYMKAHGGDW